jgi:hypothetical protein
MFILDKRNLYVSINMYVNMNSKFLYILDISSTKYSLLLIFILVDVYVNIL